MFILIYSVLQNQSHAQLENPGVKNQLITILIANICVYLNSIC